MKERPILFSGEMVKAILEGRKTQTRRVVKPQYENQLKQLPGFGDKWQHPIGQLVEVVNEKCPFGKVGDRLWVRESFAYLKPNSNDPSSSDKVHTIAYKATDKSPDEVKWKPSIHMPRAVSRLTLEVIGVRVERLQDISEEDAIAEGVLNEALPFEKTRWFDYDQGRFNDDIVCGEECFMTLWDSINAKKCPWDSNPWVWVVEFEKVEE